MVTSHSAALLTWRALEVHACWFAPGYCVLELPCKRLSLGCALVLLSSFPDSNEGLDGEARPVPKPAWPWLWDHKFSLICQKAIPTFLSGLHLQIFSRVFKRGRVSFKRKSDLWHFFSTKTFHPLRYPFSCLQFSVVLVSFPEISLLDFVLQMIFELVPPPSKSILWAIFICWGGQGDWN